MSKRRLVVLVGLLVLVWSAVGASFVSAADETRPGGTTGMAWVQTKYIWTGDVSRYGQVGVRYHIEVQNNVTVRARWECSTSNGATDQFNGGPQGGEWDVAFPAFNGANKVLSNTDVYCAYHAWVYAGAGGFRITTSAVDFWLQEFEGGSGTNPTPAPGETAGPGTSVSGPTPTPTAAPSCAGVQTVILHYDHPTNDALDQDLTYRLVTVCGHTATRSGGGASGTGGAYHPFNVPSFSWQGGDAAAYVEWLDNTITFTSPSDNHREGIAPVAYDSTGHGSYHGAMNTINVGGEDDWSTYLRSSVGEVTWGMYAYQPDSGSASWTTSGGRIWIGPLWPSGGTPDPRSANDVTPTPSPSPSPSPSVTPSPPPPPPPGYFSPIPDAPSPGPNLGGSEGLVPPSPQPHNPSGIAECDDDDGTYSKVGQAPLQALHDTAFPGSINPLDYIPWVGNMVSNVPVVVGNAGQWMANTGVDFVVPGDCVSDILTEHKDALWETGPFLVYEDVHGQLEAAMSATLGAPSAGNCTFAVPLFGGGSACIPFADWASAVSGVRNFLVVGIWLFVAFGVYRLIVGAFGVAKADIEAGGDRAKRWLD